MSDVQWYILVAPGKKVGPASFERICELAAQGKIKPTTRIRDDAGGQWIPVAEVPGVFPTSGESPASTADQREKTVDKALETVETPEIAVPESSEAVAADLGLGVEDATVVAVEAPKINPFAVRKEGRESGAKTRETKSRDKTSGGGFALFGSKDKGKNKGKNEDRKDDGSVDRDPVSDDTREGVRSASTAEETVAASSDTVVASAADTETAIRGDTDAVFAIADDAVSTKSPIPADSPKSAPSRDRSSVSRGRSTAAGPGIGRYKGMETTLKLATPAMILGVAVSLIGTVAGIVMACLAGSLLVAIGCVFSALLLLFQAFVIWLAWTFFRDWVRLNLDIEENVRTMSRGPTPPE